MTRVRPLTAIVSQVTLFNRHANGALQTSKGLHLGAPAVHHTSMRGLCVAPPWYVPTYTFTLTHPLLPVHGGWLDLWFRL